MEDVFRLKGLTHVVIVAGDSDYIPLAQRCKRLDRYVVGIGVSGSTSQSLAVACDEFADYDTLPGVQPTTPTTPAPTIAAPVAATRETTAPPGNSSVTGAAPTAADSTDGARNVQKAATASLRRAMELLEKNDLEWQHASAVKTQMKRIDPSFQERPLGYTQSSDFLKSRQTIIEIDKRSPPLRLRLKT